MSYHWSIHQLTEYFVAVSSPPLADGAVTVALEQVTEALEAEIGVVTVKGEVAGSVGFGAASVPEGLLGAVDGGVVELPGLGEVHLAVGLLDTPDGRTGMPDARLVVGRIGEAYSAEERQMLQGMALVLGLRLQSLATLATEQQRHRLVENLLQIQRAVSARRPLEEVLDAVTSGASALLGDALVGLWLADAGDMTNLRLVSTQNLSEVDEALADVARQTLAEGGTDRAGEPSPSGHPSVVGQRVLVAGEVVGCLVARTSSRGISGHDPAELLSAFAQQVDLALTDAKTLAEVRQAHRDPITSLPNRALFLQRLDQERESAVASGVALTVLFVDLDRFKAVNDTLGHRAGDELLAEVARRILTCIGDEDVAARLGGDEFAVLLRGAPQAIGGKVAERIINALTKTVQRGRTGRSSSEPASAWRSWRAPSRAPAPFSATRTWPCTARSAPVGDGGSPSSRRCIDDVSDQLSLRTDLQLAQAAGQLSVVYQPIVAIATGAVEGSRLSSAGTTRPGARFRRPCSSRSPRRATVILTLGAFVLREALRDLARWRREQPHLHMAVNISGRQVVDPQLPVLLAQYLEGEGLPGRRSPSR